MQIDDIVNYMNKNKINSLEVYVKTIYFSSSNKNISINCGLNNPGYSNYVFNIKRSKSYYILYNNKNKLILYRDKIKLDKNSEEWFFALANSILISKSNILKTEPSYELENNYLAIKSKNFIFDKEKYFISYFSVLTEYVLEMIKK